MLIVYQKVSLPINHSFDSLSTEPHLSIEENRQSVLLSQLYPRLNTTGVVLHKRLEWHTLEVWVKCDLGLDEGAQSVIGAEEWQEGGEGVGVLGCAAVRGAEDKVLT